MSFPDQFSETLSETAKRAANYLRGIGERRVAPTTETIGGLEALAGPSKTRVRARTKFLRCSTVSPRRPRLPALPDGISDSS